MTFEMIAKLIYFHRKKAGISRNELADLAGVGKTVVYDIEHGKETVQFASLSKILHVLNIQLYFNSPFLEDFKINNNETGLS